MVAMVVPTIASHVSASLSYVLNSRNTGNTEYSMALGLPTASVILPLMHAAKFSALHPDGGWKTKRRRIWNEGEHGRKAEAARIGSGGRRRKTKGGMSKGK